MQYEECVGCRYAARCDYLYASFSFYAESRSEESPRRDVTILSEERFDYLSEERCDYLTDLQQNFLSRGAACECRRLLRPAGGPLAGRGAGGGPGE